MKLKKLLFIPLLLLSLAVSSQGILNTQPNWSAHYLLSYPAILDNADSTFSWVKGDAGDITIDVGVETWADKTSNGNDYTQSTDASQPAFAGDSVTFDGTNDFMATGAKVLGEPEYIFMVAQIVTWKNNGRFIEGESGFNNGSVYMADNTPIVRARSKTESSGQENNMVVGSFHIVRVLFNGASSEIIVDNNTPVTWGGAGGAYMEGVVLGTSGDYDNPTFAGNVSFKEIIILRYAPDASRITEIYNYLKDEYGL